VGIVVEDIARVRAATDFAAVVGEQVALRRVGTRLQGLCPFHTEKTPSFYVNAAEGLYHCFGCQASGDAITFVRETQHVDFVEAVEWLAARAGVALRYDDVRTTHEQQRRAVLLAALDKAADWYHARLLTGADGGAARRYLRERGYDGDVVRQFRLGWAPDDWDALCRDLHAPAEVLTETSLGFVNRRGRQQDFFRGRVMFPIFDPGGHAIAFGGRVLPGAEGNKYKNSQETPVYAKRRTLYGLNWAKANIVQAGEVIVCEGYTDVIGLFGAGLPRAVATCGTALADDHLKLLKNFAHRVVLAYDADAAGQAAAARFYEWERSYELDIAVVGLPEGSDPGELAGRDPAALARAVAEAKPLLSFRVDRTLDSADLRTAEGRARAADLALRAIAEHPNDFVRDSYVMTVADRCRVEPQRLRARLDEVRSGRAGVLTTEPASARAVARVAAAEDRYPRAEVEALRLAVQHPESVPSYMDEVLFAHEVTRAAFTALAGAETLAGAVEGAQDDAAVLLRRLAVEEDSGADPVGVVCLLIRHTAERTMAALEAQARASQSIVDLTWPKHRIEDLDDGVAGVEAAEQLVAWVMRSAEEGV